MRGGTHPLRFFTVNDGVQRLRAGSTYYLVLFAIAGKVLGPGHIGSGFISMIWGQVSRAMTALLEVHGKLSNFDNFAKNGDMAFILAPSCMACHCSSIYMHFDLCGPLP